jgi:hypothetical protein
MNSKAGTIKDGREKDDAASLWSFGPEDSPVMVRNAERVLPHLTIFLGGWAVRYAGKASESDRVPDIDIAEQRDGGIKVVLNGPCGYELSFDDEFNAANGLASALIAAFVTSEPEQVCLHAASVSVGSGGNAAIAVLLGESFAGKSSTALQMAAAGYRLFGDDRLAVALDETVEEDVLNGLCMGLMPKVRLPLPPDCGARFSEFIDGNTEICDEQAAYLSIWDNEAATFGEQAPVAAFIMLDRRDSGDCVLERAPRGDIVRTLVANCYAPHIPSSALVPLLSRIAGRVDGYRLQFSSSRDAGEAIAAELKTRSAAITHG